VPAIYNGNDYNIVCRRYNIVNDYDVVCRQYNIVNDYDIVCRRYSNDYDLPRVSATTALAVARYVALGKPRVAGAAQGM
jgi:hypothetical protein